MNKEDIIKNYRENVPIEAILNQYQIKWSEFYKIIEPELHRRKFEDIPYEERLRMNNKYLNGISMPKIGVEHHCYHKTVSKVIKIFGTETSNLCRRTYKLNEYYFDDINTPNKAYILGLLLADGNNCFSKGTVRLGLLASDSVLLEKIKNEIDTNIDLKLYAYSQKDKGDGYHYKDMYVLDLFSRYMCKKLQSYGMTNDKSYTLEFPDIIPEYLYSHFIRGYFDGNGSIFRREYKDNRIPAVAMTITSTENFCKKALEVIRSNAMVGGNIYDASCHNGITSYISISGNLQTKRFADWLYKDADLYLERKHDRYLKYFHINESLVV